MLKQMFNTIYMYIYLIYYTERLRRDKNYMIREILRVNRERTLSKRKLYSSEHPWRV